jgi:outer membrane protein OmpA-like peptidoglycan-associated protein
VTTDQPTSNTTVWYRKRRTWIISASLLALILVILISLPYGIQFGLADFLKQHGARQVQIENIDFNPFSGRLLFEKVSAESGSGEALRLEHLELNYGWRDLFSKRARIQSIDLQGLEASVDLSDAGMVRVSGLEFSLGAAEEPAAETAEDTTPWGFALDSVALRDCSLKLQQNDLLVDLLLEQLTLQRVISWQLQQVARLSLQAQVNGAPLRVDLEAVPFDETPHVDGEFELQGFLLAGLQPLLDQAAGPQLKGGLSLRQTFSLALDPSGELKWESEGTLGGNELRVVMPQLESQVQSVRWQGKVALEQAASGLSVRSNANLALEGLALDLNRLRAKLKSLQWQGDFSLAPGEQAPQLEAAGSGQLGGLLLAQAEQPAGLVALKQIELSDVRLTPDNELAIAGVELQGIRLDAESVDKEEPLLRSQSVAIKDIRFAAAEGLAIGEVIQQGLKARLVLDQEKRLNLQSVAEQLQAAAAPESESEEQDVTVAQATEEASDPMPVKIGHIEWQGENHASFTDLSVQPPFEAALEVKQLQLSDIDSSRPEQPSSFSIQGSTGRHAEISAEGEITLFQGDPDGKIKAVLKGVEMLPLSSYTVPAIGYHLDSGELDAEIELALAKGDMEGNNHLIIRRLDVSEASGAQAEKLKAQLSMPLDTALGMLQDKHQTIDLNLPVSGKLSDPNVELGDVINTALGNALKKGAMTYLTTALFPYGTMVALLKMAGDKAGAVQLNPVEFPAAADTLDDKDKDYLGKIAGVLKERPKIAIKLCGMATQADREAVAQKLAQQAAQEKKKQESDKGEAAKEGTEVKKAAASQPPPVPDETLLELAKRRAEVVEDYLVKQHGVSPGRAAVCRPVIDPEAGALSRVDLQI